MESATVALTLMPSPSSLCMTPWQGRPCDVVWGTLMTMLSAQRAVLEHDCGIGGDAVGHAHLHPFLYLTQVGRIYEYLQAFTPLLDNTDSQLNPLPQACFFPITAICDVFKRARHTVSYVDSIFKQGESAIEAGGNCYPAGKRVYFFIILIAC